MRWVILALAVVVLAIVVWRLMPGVRQRARSAYDEYGGWTEEARKEDPVGFIEYAEGKLSGDLASFIESRQRLADAKVRIEAGLADNTLLLAAAEKLGGDFRQAYRQAAAAGAYPVELAGKAYTREEVIEQVRLILMQKGNYEEIIAGYEKATGDVKKKEQQLAVQINSTKAALATLPAKKEIARINELTASTEDLLRKVGAVLEENETLLAEAPVRTVEELIRAGETGGGGSAEDDVDVAAFLEADE